MAFRRRIGFLCFCILALGIYLVFADQLHAQEKENGKICVTNGDCASGRCSPGADLTNKYCASTEMDCARENFDGVDFGVTLRNKHGLRVKCVQGRGWANVATLISNGSPCSDPRSCSSGYCAAGPGAQQKFCLAADKNCASWGRPGFRYRDEVVTSSGRYRCTRARGGAYWRELRSRQTTQTTPSANVQAVVDLICVSNLGRARVPYYGRGQTCGQAFQDANVQADRLGCQNNLYSEQSRSRGSTPDCR